MSREFADFISPNVLTREGFSITQTNATFGGDANWRQSVTVRRTIDNPANAAVRQLAQNPNFSNSEGISTELTANWGNYFYGNGTQAKWTFKNHNHTQTSKAAAQKIMQGHRLTSYGMGDNALESGFVTFAGGPFQGDEGTGYSLVSTVEQHSSLGMATITGVARATLDTTLTQAVVCDDIPQTVTVASTTGLVVGDWLVIQQLVRSGQPNTEAVQVISIPGAGQINAIFAANHPDGSTVKPALVLTCNTTGAFGELRTIVNVGGAVSYSTGTVGSISGGGFVGSGTTWTEGMVGGDALNIGAIALAADTQTAAPFNGTYPNNNGPLKSWYDIKSITDTTHLGIHSYSCAGDQSYQGIGVAGTGVYEIRPAVQILRLPSSGVAVCEYTATTWAGGDIIQCVHCPFPDVSGFQYHMAVHTPGGVCRRAVRYLNNGLADFESGLEIMVANNPGRWVKGIHLHGTKTGIFIDNATTAAIQLGSVQGSGTTSDNAGKIMWAGSHYLMPNSTNKGTDFQMTMSGAGGTLKATAIEIVGSGQFAQLFWDGMIQAKKSTVANLPTASSTLEGCEANITDSTTQVWGAIVAGGGAFKVKVRCNGVNWTVMGI